MVLECRIVLMEAAVESEGLEPELTRTIKLPMSSSICMQAHVVLNTSGTIQWTGVICK